MKSIIHFYLLIFLCSYAKAQCTYFANSNCNVDEDYIDITLPDVLHPGYTVSIGFQEFNGHLDTLNGVKIMRRDECGSILDSQYVDRIDDYEIISRNVPASGSRDATSSLATFRPGTGSFFYAYSAYIDTSGQRFFRIFETDQKAHILNETTFHDPNSLNISNITLLDESNVIFALEFINFNYNILKWDMTTDSIHQFYTTNNIRLREIKASSDKKLYIITDNNQDRNVKLSKIDLDGNVIWSYNDTCENAIFRDLLETNDRILLVGSTCKSQTQTLPCIFELDKNGRLISKKTFTNPVLGLPSDFSKIIRSKDGNIICTSVKTTDVRNNIHTIFISKFRPDLSLIWETKYPMNTDRFQIKHLSEAGDGGFLISLDLYIPSSVAGVVNVNACLLKVNKDGIFTQSENPINGELKTKLLSYNFDHNQLRLQAEVQRGTILGIFDMSGRWIKNEISIDQTIDISDLPAGMYLIRQINSKQKSGSAEKFVKY
ncbi:MAG: T9SS type A sorting domain-containing protein [Saprospiraceae bacterium]|nr:T9SS type A sorting domain-containing protein [Saprospiraceae bacterium]